MTRPHRSKPNQAQLPLVLYEMLGESCWPGRFGLRAYPAYETGSQVHKQGKTHDGISDFENQLLQVPQNKEA